jgi:purine-binding chemotaxis protein CheW
MASVVKNYYQILGVDSGASQETIEAAYRRLAKNYHPDRNVSPDATLRMQEINEAYTVLHNPAKRAKYDREYSVQYVRERKRSSMPPADTFSWRSPPPRSAPPKTKPPSPSYTYYTPPPENTSSARPKARPAVRQEHILTFYLEHQLFGFEMRDVEFVSMMLPLVPRQGLPDFLEGTIKFRGDEIPVLDLRKLLGMPEAQVTRDTRIVLTSINGSRVGMIVDSIENFVQVPADEIDPPPDVLYNQETAFIKGIARVGFQLVVLINLPGLLTREEKNSLNYYSIGK